MTTAYLKILQPRNAIGNFTALVKALSPESRNPPVLHGTLGFEHYILSQLVTEETPLQENNKSYLRRLAEIKIQFTQTGGLNNKAVSASDYSKFISVPLPLSDFELTEAAIESENLQQRIRTVYQGRRVWTEWKGPPIGTATRPDDQVDSLQTLLHKLTRSRLPTGKE
jgi:hypothetical protein